MHYDFDPGIWHWTDKDQKRRSFLFSNHSKSEECFNLKRIEVDLSRSSKLDFTDDFAAASAALESDYEAIIWQCRLFSEQEQKEGIDPLDIGCISALQLSLRTFIEQMSPELSARSIGMIIDSIDLLQPLRDPDCKASHRVQEFFTRYCGDQREIEASTLEMSDLSSLDTCLFTLDLYDGLWALLASLCPDSWHSFLHIRETNLTLSQQAFLFSRPLFEHLIPIAQSVDPRLVQVAIEENNAAEWKTIASKQPPSIGVLCPSFQSSSRKEFLSFFEKTFAKTAKPYRLVPESRFMHLWQDLQWVVCPYLVRDRQTLRQIKGFIAAGGKAVYHSELEQAREHTDQSTLSEMILEQTLSVFASKDLNR